MKKPRFFIIAVKRSGNSSSHHQQGASVHPSAHCFMTLITGQRAAQSISACCIVSDGRCNNLVALFGLVLLVLCKLRSPSSNLTMEPSHPSCPFACCTVNIVFHTWQMPHPGCLVWPSAAVARHVALKQT
jgi:hypothetical protein